MGWLGVAISALATYLLWNAGGLWVAIAIGVGVVEFFSLGIMHNFAVEAAKKRPDYTDGFFDFTVREVDTIPNWLAVVNMLGFVASVGLLVFAVIV